MEFRLHLLFKESAYAELEATFEDCVALKWIQVQ